MLLPAGQVRSILFDHRVEAARQALDEFVGAGESGGLDDFGKRRIALYTGNVLADRPPEQKTVLQDDAKIPAQMIELELP
ncbi:hypothetical protein D3C87_1800350 [compost metagenome]